MSKGLYFYKLQSPYPEDVTKNCKLTINEVDSNFLNLKDEDIKSADFDRDSKTLILTKNDGEKLIVDLSAAVFDLNADVSCSASGVSFTMTYDGANGIKTVEMNHVITLDMLKQKIEQLIGTDILTKVITDGTLKGYGTLDSPLGLNGTEKTGMYAPVISRIDLTNGGKLPEVAQLGTRYATIEYVNDYGYLYNEAGVDKISSHVADEGRGWRVPSKADWDTLLNLIEPCEYRNHTDAACHRELGMYAGKYLKSECGWLGQPQCDCSITVPITSCTYQPSADDSYVDDTQDYGVPSINMDNPYGIDKYGMAILPTGIAGLDAYGRPQPDGYGAKSVFWTTTHVYGDAEQDRYVKVFDWNKSGVVQEAICPEPYYSVRLVKDYNGSNYFDTEYIDGVPYKTILFPQIRQIWLASNYAKKEGFIDETSGGQTPEVVKVNGGSVDENRKAVFLNEWNGCYWEKKELNEGDTVVVENTCFDEHLGEETTTVCWRDADDVEHCVDVVIPEVAQFDIEYRVFTTGASGTQYACDQDLVNTDYLAIERLLRVVVPMIDQERVNRESADTEIWEALNEEISARTEGDEALSGAVDTEREERIAADEQLQANIDAETARAEQEEARLNYEIESLWSGLTQETARAISAETQLGVDLNLEIERAKEQEGILGERIDAEKERAEEAEQALQDAIDDEYERAKAREDEIEEEVLGEIERAQAAEAEIGGQLLDSSKNPYQMSAAVGKDESNLVLETKDGNEDHFIKIMFDGNFGEI